MKFNNFKINSFFLIIALFLFVLFFCLSCAIAPVTNHYSGKSLGAGNFGLDLGAVAVGNGIPAGKFMVGISQNFDIGLQCEVFNFGILSKYSIITRL